MRALPLFAHLDERQLDRVAAAKSDFEVSAGQTLIERGAGIRARGRRAVVEAPEGSESFGPGDMFGERALFGDDLERTALVRALTDVRLAIGRAETSGCSRGTRASRTACVSSRLKLDCAAVAIVQVGGRPTPAPVQEPMR